MSIFGIDVWGNFFGGALLTLLLFYLKEKVFSNAPIDGIWNVEVHIKESSYNPYKGMVLTYSVSLRREGSSIFGIAEKTGEKVRGKKHREYLMKSRVPFEIRGSLMKTYLGNRDFAIIDFLEPGAKRFSFTQQKLEYVSGRDELEGTFVSTAANSTGRVIWQRKTPYVKD